MKAAKSPLVARTILFLACLAGPCCVFAQSPKPNGVASAPLPEAASAPADSARPRRHGSASWWGKNATPGWSLMSWKERNDHRKKMLSIKSFEECENYLGEHHRLMEERAKKRGKSPLLAPRRDACAAIK